MLNPILKKELYLLKGPIFAGAGLMLLIWINHAWVSPYLIPSTFWAVGLLALLLSYIMTSAFGHEISGHFFGGWISQPDTRKKLWRQKLTPSLMVYLGLSSILSFELIWTESARPEYYKNTQLLYVLPCLLVASLGPGIFYNLKTRNPVASLWLTVTSIPLLFVITEWSGTLILPTSWQANEGTLTGLHLWVWGFFAIYGIWGLVAAYRLFLRWEDVGNDGKALELRFRNRKTRQRSETKTPNHVQSPVRKYVLNEFRIQQLNILIGILMVGAMWATHYWALYRSTSVHPNNETQKMIAMLPSMFRYMLFILPCSIAALTIADNRRQDVITWELMLPLSRHMKWLIKFVSCLLLSWVFTVGLTWTYDSKILFSSVRPEFKIIIFYVLGVAAIIISSLSFYISSLTSSFLRSFSYSLGLLPLMAFLLGFINILYQEQLGFPIGFFAVPAGIILVLSLCAAWWSRTNFATPLIFKQHRTLNWKRWGWSVAFTVIGISIMIDRSWERVTLMEPKLQVSDIQTFSTDGMDDWSKENLLIKPKTSAIFSTHTAVYPKMGDLQRESAIALSTDGRLSLLNPTMVATWYHRPGAFLERGDVIPVVFGQSNPHDSLQLSTKRVTETDCSFYHRFILDKAGSIWMWSRQQEETFLNNSSSLNAHIEPVPLQKGVRFHDLTISRGVHALDSNGYLWRALYRKEGNRFTDELLDFEIVFPEHQWKEITNGPVNVIGLKQDGTLWTWDHGLVFTGLSKDQRENIVTPVQLFNHKTWKTIKNYNEFFLAEAEDGSYWTFSSIFSLRKTPNIENHPERFLCRLDLQGLQQYATDPHQNHKRTFYWIKQDGTLWQNDLIDWVLENVDTNTDQPIVAKPIKSRQIGRRNDWIYLTTNAGMTADGKIWNWDRIQTNRWNPFPARFRHKVVAEVRP
jgi:hypothetical protein